MERFSSTDYHILWNSGLTENTEQCWPYQIFYNADIGYNNIIVNVSIAKSIWYKLAYTLYRLVSAYMYMYNYTTSLP